MKTVKVKKGWQFKIAGKPSAHLKDRPTGPYVASVPGKLPFIKPRLLVKEGDRVLVGTPLFEDKKYPELKFLSPGGGQIHRISYGPRRVIEEIVIAREQAENFVSYDTFDASDLEITDRHMLVSHLMAGGMWPLIRQLPFRQVADPESLPRAIWITLGSADPFQPFVDVYLQDQVEFFKFGVRALQQLSDRVNICAFQNSLAVNSPVESSITHRVSGQYPASDPGVLLYHTKKTPEENQDWYIDGQDVLLIGKFLITGKYPVDRIVAFSDESTENSCHFKTRIGVRLNDLLPKAPDPSLRQLVVGGILSGSTAAQDSFLGLYQTSVILVNKAQQSELFGFIRPGFKKLSHSRTTLSAVSAKPLTVNTDMHGEKRPCINCGYCLSVCPVDIMPQYAYKCIEADEIEEALAHGLLDCVECGLCTFVCPSKIELSGTLIIAKRQYHKELSQVDETD